MCQKLTEVAVVDQLMLRDNFSLSIRVKREVKEFVSLLQKWPLRGTKMAAGAHVCLLADMLILKC